MNLIEDRLRDAISAAAQTVPPAAAHDLERLIAQRPGTAAHRTRKRGRIVFPLAAAAAVTGVAVLAAMLAAQPRPPRSRDFSGLGPAPAASPRFLVGNNGTDTIYVYSRASGRTVARTHTPVVPDNPAGTGKQASIATIATGNGRTYVVSLNADDYRQLGSSRPVPCKSWLYQFTLNAQGQPSALTPFAALPTMDGADIGVQAISGNGRELAFTGGNCPVNGYGRAFIGVTSAITGQTRLWTTPAANGVNNVSLSADGGLLLYSLPAPPFAPGTPSEVRVIPASAPPGSAAARGRTVIRAAQFGRAGSFSFADISPDGRAVYFCVTLHGDGPSEIGVISLADGHARIIAGGLKFPGVMIPDPQLRHLLLYLGNKVVMLNLRTGQVTSPGPGLKGFVPPGLKGFVGHFNSFLTW
jgi:hypothetical protein